MWNLRSHFILTSTSKLVFATCCQLFQKALMAYENTFFVAQPWKKEANSNRKQSIRILKASRARSVGYLTTFLSHRWRAHYRPKAYHVISILNTASCSAAVFFFPSPFSGLSVRRTEHYAGRSKGSKRWDPRSVDSMIGEGFDGGAHALPAAASALR